jgi:hypothetical protein
VEPRVLVYRFGTPQPAKPYGDATRVAVVPFCASRPRGNCDSPGSVTAAAPY